MFKLFKDYIYPVAVFSGGMVGVGFLSLPYITTKVGIWVMLLYFVVATALIIAIDLIFCQISLKTPDFKRAPGFVKYYLGKYAGAWQLISTIFSLTGVLLVYLIVGGSFLSSALSPFLHGNVLIYTFIYFLIASAIIYLDLKVVSRAEFWVLVLLFISLIFIFIQGFPQISASRIFNFSIPDIAKNLFLPYGALLFSLWATGLIPQTEEMLRGKKGKLKKIVVASTLTVSVFYFLFVLLILGISGSATTQTAIAGLEKFLGRGIVSVALMAGALATFTAFITQGIYLKKVFVYDLKIKHWQAFVMTCFPALILLLLGVQSFIPLISFIGGILLGIDGILILLMYKKIGDPGRASKNFIIYSLSIVFLLGVIYEIIYFIK